MAWSGTASLSLGAILLIAFVKEYSRLEVQGRRYHESYRYKRLQYVPKQEMLKVKVVSCAEGDVVKTMELRREPATYYDFVNSACQSFEECTS